MQQTQAFTLSTGAHELVAGYAEAKPVAYLGLLGVALSLACAIVAAVHGMMIEPEGDLTKAITFDGAVGVYLLTIALFVPFAHFTPKGRRRWLGWTIGLVLFAYSVETIQILRGLDPRFSKVAPPPDKILGGLFFVSALGVLTLYAILIAKVIVRGTTGPDGLVLLSIRYASGAAMIAFAAGVWMTAVQGRRIGPAGNILPLHALGFHALQAIPIIGWFLSRSTVPEAIARKWIRMAGLAWIAACLLVVLQTALGHSVAELSPPMLLSGFAILVWTATFLKSARAWWRVPSDPSA